MYLGNVREYVLLMLNDGINQVFVRPPVGLTFTLIASDSRVYTCKNKYT